jgi:hypothetical protein
VDEAMQKALPAELLEPAPSSGEVDTPPNPRTVVEAVTPVDLRAGEKGLSDAFEVCLGKLSDVVEAYRIESHHPVRRITRQRLPFLTLYRTRTLEDPIKWDEGPSVMLLHMNVPYVPDELSADRIQNVALHLSISLQGHPLMLSSVHATQAQVALEREGDYAEALVQTQIAGEILLDGILTLTLWEEGTTPEDGAALFEEGLRKRIRTHYASRLGGDWNPATSAPLSDWLSKVAYVRGRVVHAGYRPSLDEAVEARRAGEGLLDFIKTRLIEVRTRYPRSTLMTLGRPGLERRGAWSGQIRRFAELQASQEPDWLASYGAWRDRFEQARNGP